MPANRQHVCASLNFPLLVAAERHQFHLRRYIPNPNSAICAAGGQISSIEPISGQNRFGVSVEFLLALAAGLQVPEIETPVIHECEESALLCVQLDAVDTTCLRIEEADRIACYRPQFCLVLEAPSEETFVVDNFGSDYLGRTWRCLRNCLAEDESRLNTHPPDTGHAIGRDCEQMITVG